MNEFNNYHPIVNFIYFVIVIGFSMFFMNPVCLIISFFCGFLYSVILGGRKKLKFNFIYMMPLLIVAALVNPMFNHKGVTVITYFPGGNPFTLESAVYGIMAAVMLVSVIFWFSCYNEIMTSDKFIYLFGKIIPSLSLIFSMTLRFVPRFSFYFKETINARKCIGFDVTEGSFTVRLKNGLAGLSASVTRALENSIETSDSMKSRGYGLKGRTSFSVFRLKKRDAAVLVYFFVSGIYIISGNFFGKINFIYFPELSNIEFSAFSISIYAVWFGICIFPVVIEIMEAIKWRYLRSKI